MVFYNVISKRRDERLLNIIKNASIYLGIGAGLGFFVFKVIIERFLPDYVMSISLLSITFIAIPYIMISKILIANLYKTTVSEYKYFRDSIFYAVAAFILIFLADLVFNSLQAVAFATTMAYILWFLYTSRQQFTYLKSSIKEIVLLISHFVVFFFTANYLSTAPGLILYIIYLLIVIVWSKDEIQQMVQLLKE